MIKDINIPLNESSLRPMKPDSFYRGLPCSHSRSVPSFFSGFSLWYGIKSNYLCNFILTLYRKSINIFFNLLSTFKGQKREGWTFSCRSVCAVPSNTEKNTQQVWHLRRFENISCLWSHRARLMHLFTPIYPGILTRSGLPFKQNL